MIDGEKAMKIMYNTTLAYWCNKLSKKQIDDMEKIPHWDWRLALRLACSETNSDFRQLIEIAPDSEIKHIVKMFVKDTKWELPDYLGKEKYVWKTRMLPNKLQIKKAFGFSNRVKLTDKECANRAKYIIHKMSEAGYETKCYIKDLIAYRMNELKGLNFDNADYIAKYES